MKTFRAKVIEIVKGIKKSNVLSYKEVAEKAGVKNAYRAVGNIMKNNSSKEVPCHRVVCSNMYVGEYNKGIKKKVAILKKEGVKIKNNFIIKD